MDATSKSRSVDVLLYYNDMDALGIRYYLYTMTPTFAPLSPTAPVVPSTVTLHPNMYSVSSISTIDSTLTFDSTYTRHVAPANTYWFSGLQFAIVAKKRRTKDIVKQVETSSKGWELEYIEIIFLVG